ncbi:MAG: GMC family oxidoreductase [Planctomycetota bacterium]|nr:GMC family oxidoreductase [Planctomycetota bacterium]
MDYDVIIIGSGAGGGTLAHALAPSGLRVLILERGDVLPRERENWDEKAVFADKRYLAKETWYDRDDQPFSPYTHYWVGGNTKVYGAALLRMRVHDFGEVRHYGGISPAWPISYDDLEPYYTRAERLYSVHGDRGSDPHEPPASAPFPFPFIEPEPRIKALFDDLRSQGYRPFPIPLGVRLDRASPTAAPYRFSAFDGYPDLTEVKADAHVCCVQPALARENVSLVTRAYVERLVTDPRGGTVTEVVARRDGERLVFRGSVVVLACGAINSAALLLRSASDRHPHGLANGSDQVGRNYMCHQNGCFLAVTQERNPSQFQKHFGMTDFYCGAPDSPLPLGTIQLMGKPDRGTIDWLRGGDLPGVSIDDIASRTIDFFLTAEDLPDPNNRITIRPDGAIKVSYRVNNAEAYERLATKLGEALSRAEMSRGRRRPEYLAARLGVGGVSHQNGTLRFGTDPATSVLDVNCKAHELDNLYAVDGSFFPSSSAVNPSLTIMANALRVAEHLLGRLGVAGAAARRAEETLV